MSMPTITEVIDGIDNIKKMTPKLVKDAILSKRGANNGLASLDENGLIPMTQIPEGTAGDKGPTGVLTEVGVRDMSPKTNANNNQAIIKDLKFHSFSQNGIQLRCNQTMLLQHSYV